MAIELSEKQIKDGWQIVKFGEIAKNIVERIPPKSGDEKKFIGLEHIVSGSLKVDSWGSETVLKAQAFKIKKGDIIYPKRNTYLRRVAVSPHDCIGSADFIVIRPQKVSFFIPDLLKFIMLSEAFHDFAIANSAGSLSKRTKWKLIAEFEFPLPPIKRQKEILEVLEKAQNCIIQTDKSIDTVLSVKRITISKLYSSKRLERCSKIVRLKDVFDIVSGQVDPKEEPYASLPHIAPDNISKCTGQLLKYQSAKQDAVTSGKYEFDETWFLYSKIRPNLRKICYPRFRGVCSADVYPIKGKNVAHTEYLFYLMQSEHFNRYAESNSMRSGFPKINRDDLGVYQFYLPNFEAQLNTIKVLDEYDKTYQALLTHREKIIKLNIKLLTSALAGGAQ